MGLWERIAGLLRGAEAPAPESEGPTGVRRPTSVAEVVAELQHMVANLSDHQLAPQEVDPRASLLEDAVLDSVAGVQLLVLVEERYGVVIDEVELAGGLKSLDEMAQRVIEVSRSAGR